MEHDRMLNWRIEKGIEPKGRTPAVSTPIGLLPTIIHRLFYKRKQERAVRAAQESVRGPRIFKQNAGGSLGSAGRTNGA